MNKKQRNFMIFLQISCAILLSSDAVAWGFRGSAENIGRYMVVMSNFLVFLFSDIILFIYHGYVCYCLFGEQSQMKKDMYRVKLVYIICIISIILVVLSQFFHFYYYIDAQNYYHRNSLYLISLVLPMSGMITDLTILIEYRKNVSRELFISMISYIVLPLAASLILIFYYGISLINIAISISVMLMFFEVMIEQGRKVALQERILAQTERKLADSRISSMMGQIRNHFIFNVLGTISTYCKIDPEKADEAIIRFSRYLRRNIRYLEEKEMIPFEDEVALLEDYVKLEKIRFGDMVEFGEDFEVTEFLIPPLTVQPLVENAIKHGLTKAGRKGCVCVLTRKEGNTIRVEIVDDGVGFILDKLENSESVGIKNVRQRLEYMAKASLKIESKLGKGTRVIIQIPLSGGERYESYICR